jgi:hypothetical protein
MSDNKYELQEKLRAAYALNMCTVSVSQIVDYNDEYIVTEFTKYIKEKKDEYEENARK